MQLLWPLLLLIVRCLLGLWWNHCDRHDRLAKDIHVHGEPPYQIAQRVWERSAGRCNCRLDITLFLSEIVNTIHPEPEIHEHIYVTKRLRNNVHDYKHILTYIETNVTNNVNNMTHTDELTVQH